MPTAKKCQPTHTHPFSLPLPFHLSLYADDLQGLLCHGCLSLLKGGFVSLFLFHSVLLCDFLACHLRIMEAIICAQFFRFFFFPSVSFWFRLTVSLESLFWSFLFKCFDFTCGFSFLLENFCTHF